MTSALASLADAFASGRVVDAVVVLALLEGLLLVALHRTSGRGVAPRDFALNLVSGICLMLALRGALVGAGWPWIAAALAASGLAHGADLVRHWRSAPS